MKLTTVTLLCGVLLAGFSVGAMAQDDWGTNSNQGPYVELQYGRSQLQDHSFNIPGGRITTDSNNGDVWLLNSGYQFANWGFGSLRAEAELGWRSNGVGNQSYTPAGMSGKLGLTDPYGHTQVWSLMFNIVNDFRPGTAFDPYIGVGVGYARVDFHHYGADGYGPSVAAPGLYPGNTFIDDVDGQPAYQGIIGFRSQLSDSLALDVNWRYFATRNLTFHNTAGQSVGSRYRSDAVMVGLAWTY